MINNFAIFPDWNAPANVHGLMTLRGCQSMAETYDNPYAHFNLATHVGDEGDHVLINRQRLKEIFALPSEPYWLSQTHSNKVVEVDHSINLPNADASFSHSPHLVCVVMTADCLPVLFCSQDGQTIAAVHAGWRGLASGILTRTVTALNTSDLIVWLGAAIGPTSFEVGDDVRRVFVKKSSEYAAAFNVYGNKWRADIYQLARIELAGLHIFNVFGGHYCTVTDAMRFYSYRRDQQTGRMATLIWRT
jgi:YfiH family protein